MGPRKSKMKKEGKVAPKVNIDSLTMINTSSGFHLIEFHSPTVSNIVILGSCACLMAAGVVFLYSHLSKKQRRKEARLVAMARTDPELGLVPQGHRIMANPPWSPGGPWLGTAYHAGESTANDALPYILAMARCHEEQEFQQGAAHMTELWEDS